jgi:hypothetical protein
MADEKTEEDKETDFELDPRYLSSNSRLDEDPETIIPETCGIKSSLSSIPGENYDVGVVFGRTEDVSRNKGRYERDLANVVEKKFGGYVGEDEHGFCDVHYHLGNNLEAALGFLRHAGSQKYVNKSFLFIVRDKD